MCTKGEASAQYSGAERSDNVEVYLPTKAAENHISINGCAVESMHQLTTAVIAAARQSTQWRPMQTKSEFPCENSDYTLLSLADLSVPSL
jgi:hypothetical protein